ncbi:glutamate--tRNA ligase [Proteiniborus sp. MB09-C3]|uniref:glutamate--tRNA ligase n=1 Tax=Proteiniborus sp. MB09-C3 TaxID=3050072 RepID=UPI002557C2F8|nr:glutamate--tRNA ligase [Proteiniborus sp. MB09-C3]WIV10401.1 glutamate--tRNA ligase [Proteiniborus sp. MB09-C3]
MSKIRTRFAPSPTGYMHVGNLRTALYAYLISKHENGDFILRIEDTDQERLVEDSIDIIYNTLKDTGLKHDEGPDIGGPVGPYVQSQRNAQNIYMEYAKKLVETGKAYYCFCTPEELSAEKKKQEATKKVYRYNKKCLHLSKEEIEQKLKDGVPFVIRQNNPTEGTTSFDDIIYGRITVDNSELEDMVLIKSDGYPTYNFANVVDDHLMGITHVVRGNEYLSSTPKYNRLYDDFGWEKPVYIHCSPIMKDEQNKLSKRNGDASFGDLVSQGYLKEAILNYIALLGWSPSNNQELFSLDELVKIFDYKRINKSSAIFNKDKLAWMNGEYIKKLSLDEFHQMAIPYYKNVITKEINLVKISELLQSRINVLSEITEVVGFFENLPEYTNSLYINKKSKCNEENALVILRSSLELMKEIKEENWIETYLFETLSSLSEKLELKNNTIFWALRIAVSGKMITPGGAMDIAEILGKDETLRRINRGIEKLSES